MKEENEKRLREIEGILKFETDSGRKNYDEALRLLNKNLDDDPECTGTLAYLGFVLVEQDRWGMARAVIEKCINKCNGQVDGSTWYTYGRTFRDWHDMSVAQIAFEKAMACDPRNYQNLTQIGALHNTRGEPRKAIPFFEKALKLGGQLDPKHNLSMSKLALRDWTGWDLYEEVLGKVKDRKERLYRKPPDFEPRWDGSKGQTVIAYGEQGLGDEITFASCLPDLIRDSRKVVIECDQRLENLFRRSFPEADVYGTRFLEEVEWPAKYQIDARASFGSLPRFYRRSDESFPGKAYLTADPERRIQWRSLLASISDRPKIGIAWTGGSKKTGKDRRSLRLEQFLPLLTADADFVSLEYIEERVEEVKALQMDHGIKVHHWPRAVISDKHFDYDETAALVSELDMVIGVTTASLHLAGALGVKTWALVPEWPTWLWGVEGNSIPWHSSVKLYRQRGTWDSLIARISHDFKNLHRNGPKATGSLQRPTTIDHPERRESPLLDNSSSLSAA